MKLNTVSILALSLVSFAQANADSIPGGYTYRTLRCIPTAPSTGVDYGLVITTQALAPQFNVRAGSFTKTIVYPGAIARTIPMDFLGQDINYAYFSFQNYNVYVSKRDFTASITSLNGRDMVYYNCAEIVRN